MEAPLLEAPLLRERPRRRRAAPLLVPFALGLLALAGWRRRDPSAPTLLARGGDDDDGSPPRAAAAGAGATARAPHRIEVPMTEFLRFDAVWDWLVARGLGESLGDWKSTKREGALLGYLPSRLTIDLDPGLVAGALGEAAHGGFVAFNLYTGTTASWNVVMDLRGRLYQVAPSRYGGTGSLPGC